MSFPKFLDVNTVVIYTGNVMKQANINTFKDELASCLENTLKNVHSSFHIDQSRGILEIPSPFDPSYKLKDRNDFEITAKLFYLPSSSTSSDNPSAPPPSYISQSLHHLFCLLGITYVDSFIVYFNGLLFDDQDQDDSNLVMNDFEALVEVWKELESHYRNDRIKKLGVSEFTKNRFERFLEVVEVPPKIDQINIKGCCDLPSQMIGYAKEHDIELLTHRDPSDILPSTTFQKVLKNTKFPFTSELLPRWVLKYSVLIKCREVVANKG
ncbi:6600_t:CDS:2 [Cetraspora pellucida]|uniref:6600_t:CDS:1 n=1 Tax=Cetraspora pellucida TaxID=1433469 RepID=A0ACA9L7M2_9GLOM|nr:6600_t:CDS:2 [Cetraspora pellucida]